MITGTCNVGCFCSISEPVTCMRVLAQNETRSIKYCVKAHSPAGSRTLVVCGGQRNGQATQRADRKVLHVAGVKNKIISREKGRWLSALP